MAFSRPFFTKGIIIKTFIHRHPAGLAALVYLADLRPETRLKNIRRAEIAQYILLATGVESLAERATRKERDGALKSFIKTYRKQQERAASFAAIAAAASPFDAFSTWQKSQSTSNEALLFEDWEAQRTELAAWIDDKRADYNEATAWRAAYRRELAAPLPLLDALPRLKNEADYEDALQAAAAASPAQLGDMLACAGSLLIYGIPEDGGRISPHELDLIGRMKKAWGLI